MKTLAPDYLLAVTLRAIGDAVISCDREGNIFLMNAVAEELTGWREGEVLGKSLRGVFVLVDETSKAAVEDPVARVLRQGQVAKLATRVLLLRRNGEELPVEDSAAPVYDAEGTLRGVVLVFRDVSDRRRAEWNLEMLSESGRALGEAHSQPEILRRISEVVSRHFADFCLFDLVGSGTETERTVGVHRDPGSQASADALQGFRPRSAALQHPTLQVLRSGKPAMLAAGTDEVFQDICGSEAHFQLARKELRLTSMLAVPLLAEEEMLGALTFCRQETRDGFSEQDVAAAGELGKRIGLALRYARVREELRMQQARLDAIVRSVPVGLMVAEADGKIVLLNEEVEHILRYKAPYSEDAEAHAEYVAYHMDGRQVLGEEFPLLRAMAEDRTIRDERYVFRKGDGAMEWVSLSAAPVKLAGGTISGGVVSISDVHELVHAQQNAERSGHRLRVLLERASVGVGIRALHGGMQYANDVLLEWIGYSKEEMAAGLVRWDRMTPPEFALRDQHALMELREMGRATPYEKAYLAKDGRQVPMLVGAVLIPSLEEGHEGDIAVFHTDLTLQKRAETALLQTEKLTAVGRLASSISHEINNPLEAVTNLLYLLRQEKSLSHNARDYIDTAERELSRVSQITSQTLRFHRQSTSATAVQLEALLEEVLGIYRSRLVSSEVLIARDYAHGAKVICYEGDIRQVLNNLVGNAFDAMRRGGTLRLRTRDVTQWSTGQKGVRVTIADSGPGMPAPVQAQIFDAFFSTKGIHGTGLGLWISKRIVHKHRGQLAVRSCTGTPHGTVFQLWLPLELADSANEAWHSDSISGVDLEPRRWGRR